MFDKDKLKEITGKIITKAGGISKIAKLLNESRSTVYHWKVRGRIPQHKLTALERELGIPREEARPDLKDLFR